MHVSILSTANLNLTSTGPLTSGLTVFNIEFGRYLFLRAPQGLSSSGDAFNANTNQFYSGLGKHLLKQVDDMYIQGTSMDDLNHKLRVATSYLDSE